MADAQEVKLGAEVADSVSGFAGIATARTSFLGGHVRVEVTGRQLDAGKPQAEWFDEDRLTDAQAPERACGFQAPAPSACNDDAGQ